MSKKISVQYDLQKIPVIGLVAETKSSAPGTPANGQVYYDTTGNRLYVRENGAWVLASQTGAELTANKAAASGYASLDSGTKVPIAQIPTGTTGTTVPFGNDARFTDTRTPTDNTVTSAKIVDGAIVVGDLNAALLDAADATTSLRMLGYTATKAMPGVARLDQIAVPTASVDWNGQKITGLGAPTLTSDAARLADVQAAQAGIDNKPSVRLVSTTQRALSGLAAIDGVTPVATDRILLTGQTTASQNGPWVAASGAWTRPANETVTSGSFWLATEGTTYGGSQWKVATPDPITLDTTSLSITQWGAAGTVYTGTSNRISVSGSAIDIDAAYVGQTSITTLGTIATGTWSATAIAVAKGGTGATTAAAAADNLLVPSKYTVTLGALTAGVEATVTHSLNTTDTVESFKIAADGTKTDLAVRTIDANSIGVTSDIAYGASAILATVIG